MVIWIVGREDRSEKDDNRLPPFLAATFVHRDGTASAKVSRATAALIKIDIINQLVDHIGLPKTKAEKVVETFLEGIKEALIRGERVEFRGFGIFEVRPRKGGVGPQYTEQD